MHSQPIPSVPDACCDGESVYQPSAVVGLMTDSVANPCWPPNLPARACRLLCWLGPARPPLGDVARDVMVFATDYPCCGPSSSARARFSPLDRINGAISRRRNRARITHSLGRLCPGISAHQSRCELGCMELSEYGRAIASHSIALRRVPFVRVTPTVDPPFLLPRFQSPMAVDVDATPVLDCMVIA